MNEIEIQIQNEFNDNKFEQDSDSQNRKIKSFNETNKPNSNNKNFEGEDLYKDKIKPDDALRIRYSQNFWRWK